MVYKLRHYFPLSSLKLVYYGLFHTHLQYSLLSWGRAASLHLQKLTFSKTSSYKQVFFVRKKNRLTFFTLSLIRLRWVYTKIIASEAEQSGVEASVAKLKLVEQSGAELKGCLHEIFDQVEQSGAELK